MRNHYEPNDVEHYSKEFTEQRVPEAIENVMQKLKETRDNFVPAWKERRSERADIIKLVINYCVEHLGSDAKKISYLVDNFFAPVKPEEQEVCLQNIRKYLESKNEDNKFNFTYAQLLLFADFLETQKEIYNAFINSHRSVSDSLDFNNGVEDIDDAPPKGSWN